MNNSFASEQNIDPTLADIIRNVSANTINLYLQSQKIPQIQLFKLLIEKLPVGFMVQDSVNTDIAAFCDENKSPVIIDLGMGVGNQIINIITKLKSCRELTIIGIEPSKEALQIARQRIDATISLRNKGLPKSKQLHVSFEEVPECIEDIPRNFWEVMKQRLDGRNIIFNASFSLHHLKDNEEYPDIRNTIFSIIRGFSPKALYLSEPNSNHLEPDYERRRSNCILHFSTLFKLIDNLDIKEDEKEGLKMFYAREINDILGTDNSLRSERHESASGWYQRLLGSGFALQVIPNTIPNELISVKSLDEYTSYEYNGVSLVAVFKAVQGILA